MIIVVVVVLARGETRVMKVFLVLTLAVFTGKKKNISHNQ